MPNADPQAELTMPSDDSFNSAQVDYAQLISVLTTSKITAIEISDFALVPAQQPNPYHPYCVYDEENLAIPQKKLLNVYRHACVIFREFYADLKSRFGKLTPLGLLQSPDTPIQDPFFRDCDGMGQTICSRLNDLTKVMLIQNPDHVTVLSCRKQLLLQCISRADSDDRQLDKRVLNEELAFTRMILSIASHAKSGSLWEHRRWCLTLLHSPPTPGVPISTQRLRSAKIAPVICASDEEFEFSLQCSNSYPRNHYAWRHRTWLIEGLLAQRIFLEGALVREFRRVATFWTSHPRDHSCTHYISWLIGSCSSTLEAMSNGKIILDHCFAEIMPAMPKMVLAYTSSEASWLIFRYYSSDVFPSSTERSMLAKSLAGKILETVESNTQKSATLKIRYLAAVTSHLGPAATLASQETLAECRAACLGIRTFYWLAFQERKVEGHESARWLLNNTKTYPPDTNDWPPTLLDRLKLFLQQKCVVE